MITERAAPAAAADAATPPAPGPAGGAPRVTLRVGQAPGEGDLAGGDHRVLQAAVDYVAPRRGGRCASARGPT